MENEAMDFQEMKLKKIGGDLIKLYSNKNPEKTDYIKRLTDNSKVMMLGPKYATVAVLFFWSMKTINETLKNEEIGKFIHKLIGSNDNSGNSTSIGNYYRGNRSEYASGYHSIEFKEPINGDITVKKFCEILVDSCKEGKKDDLKNTIFELFNIKVDESVNSKKPDPRTVIIQLIENIYLNKEIF